MALCTLQDLKTALGITGTTEDALLVALVQQASAVCSVFTGRELESRASTEFYTGTGFVTLPLRRRPVSSVASIYYDPLYAWGNETLLTQNTDYRVDYCEANLSKSGLVYLLRYPGTMLGFWPLGAGLNPGWGAWGGLTFGGRGRGGWPAAPNALKITYTAGFVDIPADLTSAAIDVACWLYNTQEWGGMVPNTSYIDVSIGLTVATDALQNGSAPMLGTARATLQRYREQVVGTGP